MISECPESIVCAVYTFEHTDLWWSTTVDRLWVVALCYAWPIIPRSCGASAPSHNDDEWLAMVPQAA